MSDPKSAPHVIRWLVIGALLYVVVASAVYRFRHPDKTETELFLELPAAMVWK